jgi:hypothetical protein
MQRRHFETIARIISLIPQDDAKLVAAYRFAAELASTNGQFDRHRFLAACGVAS